ncbi:MAG: hypothetical protein H0W64_06590 [Gammaproteobacteria bacterium]|nr:hypothetical protein [Gammaproteobacteria bacterium]
MLKQIAALVLLSTLIVFAMNYAQQAVQWLMDAHNWVAQVLTDVFTVGQAGNIARGLLAILAIPVLIALVPTLIYWAVRRHWFPYFLEIVWVVWLVQAGALLMSQA